MSKFKVLTIPATLGFAFALLVPSISSARKTIVNCSATCTGATVGCCRTSTGKCKYRPNTGVSWEHGEVEGADCVVNGKVVGKMPKDKIEAEKEREPAGL